MALTEQKVKKVIQDPLRWFKVMTGFNPYPAQAEVMSDKSRKIMNKKGRQVGSTTVFAHKLGRQPMLHENGGLGLVISVTDSQSKMVLNMIRKGYMGSPFEKFLKKSNQRELVFDNGYRIISRAVGNSGKQARGYSPNVVYATEAGFIQDDVYNAIEPSLFNTGGKLWLESSPNGTQGRFYRAWNDDSFSRHTMPSPECPGVSKQQLEDFKKNTTSTQYRQEVLGEFVSDDTNYFSTSKIKARMELSDLRQNRIPDTSQFYLGVDVARHGDDETVYYLLEKPQNVNKLYSKRVVATEKKPLTDVMGRIKDFHEKYSLVDTVIDENSVGGGVVDVLKEDGVPHTPVKFSQKNKHEMYESLKFKMENGSIKLPDFNETGREEHQKLYEQLNSLQFEYSRSGLIKVSHPTGGHDDFPDALAAAVYAADTNHSSKATPETVYM